MNFAETKNVRISQKSIRVFAISSTSFSDVTGVSYKQIEKRLFGPYQKFGMGNKKWVLLYHLVDSIRQNKCAEYLHNKMFECLHRNFESLFKNTFAINDHKCKKLCKNQEKVHVQKYFELTLQCCNMIQRLGEG